MCQENTTAPEITAVITPDQALEFLLLLIVADGMTEEGKQRQSTAQKVKQTAQATGQDGITWL